MNILIDTHTHIYDEEFDSGRDEAVLRAKQSGIAKMILPAIDKKTHPLLLATAQEYPNYALPCAGLHPTSVDSNWQDEIDFVSDELAKRRYFAVGETGIDGYWSKDFIKEQKIAFRLQIELAAKYNIPVIIHSREATAEIFEVLDECKHLDYSGVFHAFSGSYETYKRVLNYGNFMMGIGGVITYKNSHLPETVAKMDLKRLILETDSPWLTPVPHRGKRNEPSYLTYIVEKIASVMNIETQAVASQTTTNAIELFKLDIKEGGN